MKKIRYIFFLIAVAIGVMVSVGWLVRDVAKDNRFTLINETDRVLPEVIVDVCGQSFHSHDLSPRSKHTFSHVINGKCTYDVHVSYSDGSEGHEKNGYVTRDLKHDDIIRIRDKSIIIEMQLS